MRIHPQSRVACAAAVCFATSVSAVPITVGFTGTMVKVGATSAPGLLGIAVGAGFSGTLTIDEDDVTGSAPGSQAGTTDYTLSEYSGVLVMDGVELPLHTNAVNVGNDFLIDISHDLVIGPFDRWNSSSLLDFPSDGFAVSLFDGSASAIPSGDLNDFFVPTSLAGWFGSITWQSGPNNPDIAQGTLATLFVVPEPSTAALTAAGLVGLASRRRRPHP